MKRGCPQGSTFGPLMWNIFQKDLPNIISDANVLMYADDHQVFVAHETMKRVEKILVDNGEKMTKWYQDNLLKVNVVKIKQGRENIGTLATFRTTIRKKDVTSFLEGCGSECHLCLG